jgi:hypothetical protein
VKNDRAWNAYPPDICSISKDVLTGTTVSDYIGSLDDASFITIFGPQKASVIS